MNSLGTMQQQNTFSNSIANDVLFKYIERGVKLEVAKEMAIENMENLRKKRAELVEEKRKLNNLHQQVFSMNNDMCESVWKFSNRCDFPSIVRSYSHRRMETLKTKVLHHSDFTRLEEELQNLSEDVVDLSANLKKLSDRHIQVKAKEESTVHIQSSISKCETKEASKVPNNIPSSKFVFRRPTVILESYKKR